ncbi:hypothetical protein [Glaciecola petra]|uniref:Uncharacterized protein n=1 Tax=Glaciecola petra TaxID=3075602 RepID=A0ABU2ZLI6_9ALTE|nr:hypothetical protein [Aestuariibacter sp. P117]MDT0593489.1 hypothetical protein [Aestuariibacter sp. P117]
MAKSVLKLLNTQAAIKVGGSCALTKRLELKTDKCRYDKAASAQTPAALSILHNY